MNPLLRTFSIGADPEFFLIDSSGALKSAIPRISGTKHNQLRVDGGGLQRDNVAAEFSCDPSSSEEEFIHRIGSMLKQLASCVNPLVLYPATSVDFPTEELEHPEAKMFGCDPDFNGYSLSINEVAADAASANLRSCGGHIHVGHIKGYPRVLANDDTGLGRVRMVKIMDLFIGVASLLLDGDPSSARRRALYGKAGCHRPKPYGVEYRTVGNFWTRSPELTRLAYRLTAMAVEATELDIDTKYINELGEGNLQRIINTGNVSDAKAVAQKYIVPHMKPSTLKLFNERAINNGIGDMYKEWMIE